MSFLSPVFLACLVPVVFAYHLLPSRFRAWVLVLTAALFYCWVNPWWAALLGLLVVLTYGAGLAMAGPEARRARVMGVAVVGIVSVLAFFKYAPRVSLLAVSGHDSALANLMLPLGLSYYTFKLLSYVIDVYWGKLAPERDFMAFAAYVSFLPQLPTGPIQRPGDFLTQLRAPSASVASGFRLILFGLFQKLVVADRASQWVDSVYAPGGSALDPVTALVAVYAYAIQLYADFSGISDIAIGLGRLFGIEAPPNFRAPYFAESLPEFWRRWHMSLTSWITDYVFMPLRMLTRNWGTFGLAVCLMANMCLIGAWHGATLALLVFGALHGALMVVATLSKKPRDAFFKARPRLRALRPFWRPIVTFHVVAASLIIFRAPNLAVAWRVFKQALVGAAHVLVHAPVNWRAVLFLNQSHASEYREDLLVVLLGLCVMAVAHSRLAVTQWILARPGWVRWAWYYAAVLAVVVLGKVKSGTFIYAQF
jgi:alginate O-acetyltransferase complex protein AlgI